MHHENNVIKFVTKKIKRLIIPYICVTILWLVPIRLYINYSGYINKNFLNIIFISIIFGNDNGHLWYLPTLFSCFIIIIFLQRIFYNKNNVFFLGIIVSSMFYIFPISLCPIEYINTTLQYFCWFCIGGIIYIYESKLNKLSITLIGVSNLFFVLLVIFLRYENFIFLNILKLVCGILCICLIYRLTPNTKINKFVNKIASNSFGIYLLHSPLVYITYSKINNGNPIIVILINFFIFGALTYFLTNIIRYVKLNFIIGE